MSAAESTITPRKIWTRAEVDRLSLDDLRLELVNGELLDRMGKKPPHVYWKTILGGWLRETFGNEYVRSEDPIDVAPEDNPTSEPEPDLIVTVQPIHVTRGINPKPEDLRLVIEVSDTTYEYDMKIKAYLYARAGIGEFWVLDVRDVHYPRLIVHLEPTKEGGWKQILTYGHDEEIKVLQSFRLNLMKL